MTRLLLLRFGLACMLLGSALACRETTVVADASADTATRVTDAAIEQYVFRAFVDLVGNAPTEAQLATWRTRLREGGLDTAVRGQLVTTLQTDADFRAGYALNLYGGAKVRFLENFPDAEIERRLVGLGSADDDARLRSLLSWTSDYLAGGASVLELQRRAIYNLAYDELNMGSFNFVRASFDNLLWRYPTAAEYDAGFAMVERGRATRLFASDGASKDDYVRILTTSPEALEGTIIWQYDQFLARRPTAAETLVHLDALRATGNVLALQRSIILSDEYAGF